MPKRLHRLLLVVSALIFAFSAWLHTSAFGKAQSALEAVALPPFYAHSFAGLWLIDSATLLSLAIVFVVIAAHPALATRWVIVLLALIPASTSALIFVFVGSFPPPYILGFAALLAVLGGLGYPGTRVSAPL